MFYVIRNTDNQYFNSGSTKWVSSFGTCATPSWGDLNSAWASSSQSHAQSVASRYGGEVISLEEAKASPDNLYEPRRLTWEEIQELKYPDPQPFLSQYELNPFEKDEDAPTLSLSDRDAESFTKSVMHPPEPSSILTKSITWID